MEESSSSNDDYQDWFKWVNFDDESRDIDWCQLDNLFDLFQIDVDEGS